jgi:hypothetical protein
VSDISNQNLTIRIDDRKRKWLKQMSEKNDLSVSKYLTMLIDRNMGINNVIDGEMALRELIGDSVAEAIVVPINKIHTRLNAIDLVTETILLQNDMTLKYFGIPQKREELKSHINEHPITEVAREEVIKRLRQRRLEKRLLDE